MTPLLAVLLSAAAPGPALRVCADPNNLPFSNAAGQGFENRIAEVLARDLGVPVRYTWHAQRRGFLRETLQAGACDVVMGVPVGLDRVAVTRPYYRSAYVLVSRRGGPRPRALDDPSMRRVRVGVPLVGDDGADPPPVHALAARGIIDNVRGFPVYGDYAQDSPPLDVMRALAAGAIDVAIVWGPLGGYYRTRDARLVVTPLPPDGPLPFSFDIAVATRRGDARLRARLDRALARRHVEIRRVLHEYGVPTS